MIREVSALVHNPGQELADEMLATNRLAQVTRTGILVVRLLANPDLSRAAYTDEWQDKGADSSSCFGHKPNFSNGPVHEVYDLPEQLSDQPYELKLEAAEFVDRGPRSQIVTGYDGEPIRPYRRITNRSRGETYGHPTQSVFSDPRLAKLEFAVNPQRTFGRVSIYQAEVAAVDGLVTVTHDKVFSAGSPGLVTKRARSLPAEHQAWNPALTAMYEQLACHQDECDGHYNTEAIVTQQEPIQ